MEQDGSPNFDLKVKHPGVSTENGNPIDQTMPTFFMPIWSHPDWRDHACNFRNTCPWRIVDQTLDVVRPAMLASDQDKNPTDYALRFGIFPGRNDGRSCTSPTRSTFRPTPSGGQDEGRFTVDEIQWEATVPGEQMEGYIKSNTNQLDRPQDPILKAFDQMILEEYWQGCLFGDMTTDELIAGDHFSMGNSQSQLSGSIHPFLDRNLWFFNPWIEHITVYHLDGQLFEMNAATSDRIWIALRPALLLATKLINHDEKFLSALMDITNRYPKKPAGAAETAPKGARKDYVVELRADKSEALGYKDNVRPSPTFDMKQYVLKLLYSRIRWRLGISSSDMNFPDHQEIKTTGPLGLTLWSGTKGLISISVSSEIAWQLLSDKLSASEKLMVSQSLAVTMMHELCHAINDAVNDFIVAPQDCGVTDPQDLLFCKTIANELHPYGENRGFDEPFYESDPVKEVGHAYERHVLGGNAWPLAYVLKHSQPRLLAYYSGILMNQSHLEEAFETKHDLPDNLMGDKFNTFSQHGAIQSWFREEFWDTAVRKYGLAVLRASPLEPTRMVIHSTEATRNFFVSYKSLDLGSAENLEWIMDYLMELYDRNLHSLRHYVTASLDEAFRFELAMRHFHSMASRWKPSYVKLLKRIGHIIMIILEFKAFRSPPQTDAADLLSLHEAWLAIHSEAGGGDPTSKALHGSLEDFLSNIRRGPDTYDERLVRQIVELSPLVDEECCMQETMVCQLFDLPKDQADRLYPYTLPGHRDIWRQRVWRLSYHLKEIVFKMNKHEFCFPSFASEWRAKMSSWITGLDSVYTLLSADSIDTHQHWRSLLARIPMLRKCGQKVWQRRYFLAKKAMLNLSGQDYEKFLEFRERTERILLLSQCKLVLRGKTTASRALIERWAYLLDDLAQTDQSWEDKVQALTDRHLSLGVDRLNIEEFINSKNLSWQHAAKFSKSDAAKKLTQDAQWRYDTERAQEFFKTTQPREAENLNQLREAELNRHSALVNESAGTGLTADAPQITRPMMSKYPTPYSMSQPSPKRELELPDQQTDSGSTKRPRITEYVTLEELTDSFGADNPNTFAASGRSFRPVPRQYEMSGNILDELADGVQSNLNLMMDVDDPMADASQAWRDEIHEYTQAQEQSTSQMDTWRDLAHKLAAEARDFQKQNGELVDIEVEGIEVAKEGKRHCTNVIPSGDDMWFKTFKIKRRPAEEKV